MNVVRRIGLALLLLGLCSLAARPAVGVPLAEADWVFAAFDPQTNRVLFQEQLTWTKQNMKIMGQDITQTQEQSFLVQWTPKDRLRDGSFVVDHQIVGVKITIDIGGNKIEYDSTQPSQAKSPMVDFFTQLMKCKLTFTLSPDLRVKKIEGREKFLEALTELNPQMQALLKGILSEQSLAKMAEPMWYAFPDKGIIPGSKTWTRKSELDMGPLGKYNTTFDFTHKGFKDTRDRIVIKTRMEYSAPADSTGLPFKIVEAKIASEEGLGEALFNRGKGRFDSTLLTMKLSGTLKMEVGDQTTTVELTQEQISRSTLHDEIPAGWKPRQE
jgi:hypothetical protein